MEKCLFEVGMRVWSVAYGWGTVKEIVESSTNPVRVMYDKGVLLGYTYDGKIIKNQNRTLFFEEIVIPQSALEIPRKTAEEMLEECEEVEFITKANNYSLFCNTYAGVVELETDYTWKRYGVKYISLEDAKRIVRECKENN